MTSFQFSQSLLGIMSPIGLPSVFPLRTPHANSTRSSSTRIRPPRPYPFWRRIRSRFTTSGVKGRPAGTPSRMARRYFPWDSPPFKYRSMVNSGASALHDNVGGEEDQQLLLRDGLDLVLEEPAQHRNAGEIGDATHGIGLGIHEDSAEHDGFAIASHNLGGGFAFVDTGTGRIASGTHRVARGPDL